MEVESKFREERLEDFVQIILVCEEKDCSENWKIFLTLFWKFEEQSSENFESMFYSNV